jgi:N-acetylneuraminic acid mutarotase
LLASGKVLVVGGFDTNFLVVNSAELYNPATNSWAAAGTPPVALADHAATLLPSGKVLVTGGQGPRSSAELYDPALNSWSSAQAMHDAREDHTATLLSTGLVLVAGGDQGSTALIGAEVYDPVSDTWSNAGSLVTGRENHTANLLPSGQVLVAGGSTSVASGGTTLGSAELYNADLIFADNFDGTLTVYP